uniref:Cuticular protein analogous to peritrophins 1-F n=2 Tax=Daphnia magna TaxID=35525 RepID=A0A0P4Y311_9CRUS
MIIAKRSLIFSILLVGLLGVAEVVSTKKGKGRRLQQRPFAPAYHNVPFSQSRIPSYHTLPSGYPTPPALRQPPARPVAPRPGIVVFGVGPNSLQIPNHYTNYAGAPQQTKPIVIPAPAYAPPTAAVTRTPPKNQPAVSNYAKPVHNQQNVEQTRYHPQPIQPTYPVQSPQYGNRFPVVQPESYQQPSAQVVAVPAPIPVTKPQVNIPTYVAPAKSTVYGSAYVANSASYPASDSYTRGEASKPVGSVPAPYQSPVQQPQENYGTTPTVSYTSKPTAIYIGTKSEQSIGNHGIEAPKIKESQSSYSPLSHHQIKYSTDVPYSTIESKPTSDSNEKSNAAKHQDKKPVYPTPQSYKETESLSYGEKKKETESSTLSYSKVEAKPISQPSKPNEYKVSKQEETKVKVPAYPTAQSHKKVEYQEEKKEQVSVYAPNLSPTKSETTSEDKSYQSHTQPEKSYANKEKSQSSVYTTSQSYKEVHSQSYGEQKKKVDESNLPYSTVESKPVIESSKQNAYQPSTDDKVKVPAYSASQDYKEVDSSKDVYDYKKQEATVYQPISVSGSYVKNSDSHEEENQSKKPVDPTPSYKTVESLPKAEDEKKHYEAEQIPSKPASVSSYETYSSNSAVRQEQSKDHESNSKSYESKYTSVYQAPVKEENAYSKQLSEKSNIDSLPVYSTSTSSPSYQYSTGYKLTTKVPVIPIEDKVKVPSYFPSKTYKEVEAPKDVHDYKKQESAVYKHTPVSDSYVKHSASYVEESQPQKTVVSTSSSYKKDESLQNSEYKQKHYEAEHVPSKAADVLTNEKYPSTLIVTQEQSKYHESNSKTYESKYLSVSPATKTPVKEINIYSKPTSDESNRYSLPVYSTTTSLPSYQYSTESTTTRKVPIISIEDNVKVPAYSASQTYKEVESTKDIQHYKKPDSAVYEHTPISDSYVKHSVSYVEESQPKKTVVSNSPSYKKVKPLPNFEYKQKHYEAEHGSSKADPVPAYEKYPSTSAVTQESPKYHESNSKTYESKYPSVSATTKAPVKEVTAYSKQKSDDSNRYSLPVYSTTTLSPSYQYSTSYTTTTKAPAISYDEKTKAYYTTTPKYQEYSTSGSAVTRNPPAYQSTVAYENIPVAKTPTQKEDNKNQYSTKKDTDIKAGAPPAVEKSYATPTTTANYDVKANDRVYVVDNRDEIVETYQKKEPVSSYQSYPNPSVDGKLSSVKQVVNQYGSTDRGYNSASSDTANKSSYEGRPASSSVVDLSTYNRKPNQDSLTTSVEGAKDSGSYGHDGVEGDYSAIPGKPEIDYPIFSELPNNKFNCSEQRLPGYYADTSARCQVFHICLGDRQWSFLCPNGTIFSQQHFVCVWWYEVDCSKAPALYELNAKLFVIPSTQQAPDYVGEQRAKSPTSETEDETGKRYDTFTNKKETTSGAY